MNNNKKNYNPCKCVIIFRGIDISCHKCNIIRANEIIDNSINYTNLEIKILRCIQYYQLKIFKKTQYNVGQSADNCKIPLQSRIKNLKEYRHKEGSKN